MGKYDSYVIQKVLFFKAPLSCTVKYPYNLFCEKLSVCGVFLLLGNAIKDSVLDKAREGSVFGLLANKVTGLPVKAQLLMFVKYVDTESGVANMYFLELKICQKLKELMYQSIPSLTIAPPPRRPPGIRTF